MEEQLITKATFNEKVKVYIFLVVTFYLITSIVGILLLPLWLFGLGQWLSKKFFYTLTCELTNKNLKFSKGIILHIEKTIPLENIQDLAFIGGPILRYFGLTQLKIETAGGGGSSHQQNVMSIIGVNDAEKLKTLILDQRERVIRSMRGAEQSQNVNPISSTDLLTSIHKELKEIKEILRNK